MTFRKVSSVTVDKARALMQVKAPKPRHRIIPLSQANGRVLFAPLTAIRDQPPFAASAMDGYAVAERLTYSERQLIPLKIVGESRAGRAYGKALRSGEAVRIFTGAPVPEGAQAVIMQENCSANDGRVLIHSAGWESVSDFIRPKGLDFQARDVLIPAGVLLSARHLALASASGMARLSVARKPRIKVIALGDELVRPGRIAAPFEVFEATSTALLALGRSWGAKMRFAGLVRDRVGLLARRLASLDADLIVTLGGASVGDYDPVPEALARLNFVPDFTRIAMKPGGPSGFGQIPDGPQVLILPGNPASTLIAAQVLLKPYIAAALGQQVEDFHEVLPCRDALGETQGKDHFLRARFVADQQGHLSLSLLSKQDSSVTTSLAEATALIHRPAEAPALPAGSLVSFIRL